MEDYILAEYTDLYEEEFLFVLIEKVANADTNEEQLKCLMTINNKPIIQYQLEVLEALNISEVQIIVDSQHVKQLQERINSFEKKIAVDYFTITLDNLFGNESSMKDGKALREFINAKNKDVLSKYKNIVFLPGELLFDTKTMIEFINMHRLERNYMTLLTCEKRKKAEEASDFLVVNDKGNIFSMKYSTGKDGSNPDKISIPFNYFARYPTLRVTNELDTMKTFIVRSCVLKKMKSKEDALLKQTQRKDDDKPKDKYTHVVEKTSIHKQIIPYIIKLLIGKDGQDIKQTDLNELCNHFPTSFEPPCMYYTTSSQLTVLVTKENIQGLNKRAKSSHLKLIDV